MRNQILFYALAMSAVVSPVFCQSTPVATTAATVIPALIRYDGVGPSAGKAPTMVTFLIFKEESGGEPLWTETQTVTLDPAGKYKVYLGATNASGLPFDLFNTGEARWLEVQVAGEKPQPRVLLTSVPYALKAADAATLGGLPASAFALAGTNPGLKSETWGTQIAGSAVSPDSSSTVTTTGGTKNYVPLFTGSNTIASSEIYDTGTSVGIGDIPNAGAKLDVNGAMIMRGSMTVSRTGNATSSKGYPSYGFDFYANAYNSSTKAADNPHFILQSEPTGNNSSNTGATFNLLYSNHGDTPAETGLSINPSGVIKFASGQTFDLTSSSAVAVEGNSTSGTGVQGNSNSAIGVGGSSTAGTGVFGSSNSSYGVRGSSNTGIAVYGITSGNTFNTAGTYGVAGEGNTSDFGGIAGAWGDASAYVGVMGTSDKFAGVQGISSAGPGVQGVSTTGTGVVGISSQYSGGTFNGGVSSDGGVGADGLDVTGGSATNGNGFGGIGGRFYGGSGSHTGASGVEGSGGTGDTFAGNGGSFYGSDTDDASGEAGTGIFAEYATNTQNSDNDGYAGYFTGTVEVNGTLYANSKDFQIDHPTDPANKYLYHSTIESSEMVNIYSGNVITDDLGIANVQLPAWFKSLNGDLRYQLTVVGRKAQAWISQEFDGGKFQIASDATHVKISWQVTGVRQDAYAKAHPLVVEKEKSARERGFYKNPELYGQPAEKSIEWARNPELMRRIQAHRAGAHAPKVVSSPIRQP
jgi:hypothetical protein